MWDSAKKCLLTDVINTLCFLQDVCVREGGLQQGQGLRNSHLCEIEKILEQEAIPW